MFKASQTLDDFNRANADPAGGDWSGPLIPASQNLKIDTNRIKRAGASGSGGAWWNPTAFNANAEAWVTIDTQGLNTENFSIFARMADVGQAGGNDGYLVRGVTLDTGDVVRIRRFDNGSSTGLGADIAQALSNGDKLGIRAFSDKIEAWYQATGGALPVRLGTRTDTTYSHGGHVALEIDLATWALDNFGARNLGAYEVAVLTSPGLAAWYRMDETSGQLVDWSGNNNHTTVVNGTPDYSQAGGIGSDSTNTAIHFTASSTEWFSAPDHSTLDYGDVFTLEAWYKRDETTDASEYAMVSKDLNSGGLYLLSHSIMMAKCGVAAIVTGTTDILDTNWHHYVATKNGATSKLYVDGVDVTGTVTNQTCTNTAGALKIGTELTSGSPLLGTLDEVAVYNGFAHSQAEVQARYQAAQAAAGGIQVILRPSIVV